MKPLRLIPWSASMAAMLLAVTSCDEWGRHDPPAGNQVTPALENVAEYSFDSEAGLDPMVFTLVANPSGKLPEIIEDSDRGDVLSLNNGYVSLKNPYSKVELQKAASFTFWLKQPLFVSEDEEGNETVDATLDINSPLITFENETGNGRLYVTANGCINYAAADGEWIENDPSVITTGYMTRGDWHYIAIILRNDGYEWYVDGNRKVSKTVTDFDCSKIVSFVNHVPNMTIGAKDNPSEWLVDNLSIYRNEITDKEIARPGGGGSGGSGGGPSGGDSDFFPVEPIYFNSFDAGLSDASIMGGGSIQYIGGAYGSVFANAMNGMRENYLLLPTSSLSGIQDEMTLSVWINRGSETDPFHHMWSPIFTAYAEMPGGNGCPMFALQYRGVLSINTNGPDNVGGSWCDFTDQQCDQDVVTLYHGENDWISDGGWHFYTVTITRTSAKVYMDGELANSWTLDGVSDGQIIDLPALGSMQCICLGGNQAWGWGDPDPGFWFDDLAIYDKELSQSQVKAIMDLKKNVIYGNTFSNGADDMTLMGAGAFIDNETPGFGKIFKNAVGGMRENYLLLPETSLSKVAETNELTINVWLNSTDAGDYFWNPVFTAYAEAPGGNGCPMFACQYRGVVSINTNGPDNVGDSWCDFTDDQCDQGTVTLYHGDLDWLADRQWHLYTAVFTPTSAVVYFDGEVANSWTLDGVSRGQVIDLQTVATMKCICLGGNQAWGWGDPDPGFGFDDLMIYNKALSQDEVKQIVLMKK